MTYAHNDRTMLDTIIRVGVVASMNERGDAIPLLPTLRNPRSNFFHYSTFQESVSHSALHRAS